jgi:hypothetical protein
MLTPFVRSCSTLAAALVASAAFAAAPAFAQAVKPAPPTPQAAIDALEAAIAAGDAKGAMALLTPDGQKRLAKDAVIGSLAMLALSDPDDPNPMGPKPSAGELKGKREAYAVAKKEITAALKPSGMDAAVGKPLMPAQEIVDARMGAADAATLVPALWDAVVKAGPALGMKQKQPFMKVGPFTALNVDGDHATVKSGPRTMKIDRIGGKWLIDAPLPEPQGGQ